MPTYTSRVTLGPVASAKTPATKATKRRTQAERTALSNQRLVSAAVRVIAEKGYRAASLQAIGEVAGYSRGLVSHRFGSKEGMLETLLDGIPDPWLSTVGELTGLDALRAAIKAHHAWLTLHPRSLRALFMVMHEAQGELEKLRGIFAEKDRLYRARFVEALKAGQRDKSIRKDLDVEASATLCLALLRGICNQWLTDPKAFEATRVYGELERMLTRAFESGD